MTEKSMDELEKTILPKIELLSKVDKDTIYFDGLQKIEQEMDKIVSKNNINRVVVFIDDLDRCSPRTTLDVFESIKVFLGMKGFVYIIGLSDKTVSKLISTSYKDLEIKGEDYIGKIIQIPLTIPEWNDIDIKEKLIPSLATKLDDTYKRIVENNTDLILKAVKLNPREVKRFINNFIIAHEIYSKDKQIKATELLVVQALRARWNDAYLYLSSNYAFRNEIKKYLEMPMDEINETIANRKSNKNNPPNYYESKIFEFHTDKQLWDFLIKNQGIIFNIEDWNIYRRAAEAGKKYPAQDNPWLRRSLNNLIEYSDYVASELRRYIRSGKVQPLINSPFVNSFYGELGQLKVMYDRNPVSVDLNAVDRLRTNTIKIRDALKPSDQFEADISLLLQQLTNVEHLAEGILL